MLDITATRKPKSLLSCSSEPGAAEAGNCKNPNCGRPSTTLLGGYCPPCATGKGLSMLLACGFRPIVLGNDAAEPIAKTVAEAS